jgi:S1-C subfamily serine protease
VQPHLLPRAFAQAPTTAPKALPLAAVPAPAPTPAWGESNLLDQLSNRFEAVARRVGPCVVSLEALKPAAPGKTRPTEESGSGVLVNLAGKTVIVTNNHVVTGARPDQITVHLDDNRVFRPQQVLADPESDLAVLLIESTGLPAVALGDSDRTRIGQWVVAIGSPFGLNQSVTHGIISARDRGQVSLGSTIRIKDFLQTDAAINPGSSGGPLLNLDGELIGINTAIASQSGSNSGVAFSIPVNLVVKVVRQLLEKGAVSRGYLGVQLAAVLDPAEALKLGLPKAQGALVEAVHADTPAAQAGLKANDVILQVDGTIIRNENHLINHVSGLPVNQRVRLQVWRERKAVSVDAVVGDWTQARARMQPAR